MRLFRGKIIAYHLHFLLGAVFFILMAWASTLLHRAKPFSTLSEKYVSQIQATILDKIEVMEQESRNIEQLFQEGNTASLIELKKKHLFPCLIFSNEKLIFWSDFTYFPEYTLIQGKYILQFFELKNGTFIIHRDYFKTAEGKNIEIYTFLPIYVRYNLENSYLKPSYNSEIIPSPKITLKVSYSPQNIFTKEGGYLCSLHNQGQEIAHSSEWLWISLVFVALFVISLFIFLWKWRLYFLKKKKYEVPIIYLTLFFGFIRWLTLREQLPFKYVAWEIFNPQLYASSFWFPSLGDLAINLLIVFWLLFHLQLGYPHTWLFGYITKSTAKIRFPVCMCLIMAGYWSLYQFFWIFSTVFTDSQIALDISENIDFSVPILFCYLAFVLLSVIYFYSNHLISRLLLRLLRHQSQFFPYIFGAATLLFNFILYVIGDFQPLISLLSGLYLLLLYYFAFPKYLYRFRYFSTLYLFLASLFCAITGVYTMRYYGSKTQDIQMKKYAESLLEEKDFSAEYSLENITDDIRLDASIKEYLKTPFLDKSSVRKRIRKLYLGNDFPNYQTEVYTFDALGYPHHPQIDNHKYQEWVTTYQKPAFRTEKAERFFINETQAIEEKIGLNILRMYVDFIEIRRDTNTLGYAIIELKKRKNEPFKVYPELLQNERFREPREFRKFSYGIYKNQHLIYSYGDFNYEKKFKKTLFNLTALYQDGYTHQGFQHIGAVGEENRCVVVSAPLYSLSFTFANFSFLFLVLILLITQILLVYGLLNYSQKIQVTFTTRIQLFLNAAFFLPLAVVSITTLSIISSSYDQDLNESFVIKAQNATRSLVGSIQQYQKKIIEKDELLKDIVSVAGYAQADINLFDPAGQLITSSQMAIYDNELLSKNINPEALWRIVGQKEQEIMLEEAVGLLAYKSVYLAVHSYEDNQLLAVLSIPFFDAKDARQQKIIYVLVTIINIFTIVLIIFVIISYFASNILTDPLTLITQKIRKTTLNTYNEPLQWDSDDEIGLMVNEYNKMLIKLEQSRDALARTEKESAWREMAKQVAHEIKNPLTPMKLTLQHLQMRIALENSDLQSLTEKPFITLLTQIDLLSDIATSFSTFAKMTVSKHEVFEISEVLRHILQLYESNRDILLLQRLEKGFFKTQGDKQLMAQVFTNIVLNAIQSVPSERKAQVMVSLYQHDNFIRIEIRDNGMGIPLDIQEKVFLPNFSTKFAGSGIGLALAKRTIEDAGGLIWFETVEGQGTCFFIDLPLVAHEF